MRMTVKYHVKCLLCQLTVRTDCCLCEKLWTEKKKKRKAANGSNEARRPKTGQGKTTKHNHRLSQNLAITFSTHRQEINESTYRERCCCFSKTNKVWFHHLLLSPFPVYLLRIWSTDRPDQKHSVPVLCFSSPFRKHHIHPRQPYHHRRHRHIMSGPSIVKQATTAATKNVLRRNPPKGAQYWSRALPSIEVRLFAVFSLSKTEWWNFPLLLLGRL